MKNLTDFRKTVETGMGLKTPGTSIDRLSLRASCTFFLLPARLYRSSTCNKQVKNDNCFGIFGQRY